MDLKYVVLSGLLLTGCTTTANKPALLSGQPAVLPKFNAVDIKSIDGMTQECTKNECVIVVTAESLNDKKCLAKVDAGVVNVAKNNAKVVWKLLKDPKDPYDYEFEGYGVVFVDNTTNPPTPLFPQPHNFEHDIASSGKTAKVWKSAIKTDRPGLPYMPVVRRSDLSDACDARDPIIYNGGG